MIGHLVPFDSYPSSINFWLASMRLNWPSSEADLITMPLFFPSSQTIELIYPKEKKLFLNAMTKLLEN